MDTVAGFFYTVMIFDGIVRYRHSECHGKIKSWMERCWPQSLISSVNLIKDGLLQ